jgi:hypothetical protein
MFPNNRDIAIICNYYDNIMEYYEDPIIPHPSKQPCPQG